VDASGKRLVKNKLLIRKRKERREGMEIKKIGVLGAGTMGSSIAQLCAQSGLEVVMRDVTHELVEKGIKNADRSLTGLVTKGKISEGDKKNILSRIKGTAEANDLKGVDFVIEAVFENIDLKKELFKQLDAITGPEIILSTNTSSLSITEIAKATKRPEKVVGMHFFNPPTIMRLVEIVKGVSTGDEAVSVVKDLAVKLGKETIVVKKDVPGFVVNRLMMPHFIEAIRLYEEGIASLEDIDKAAKLGLNYPMGPFELMDFGGIDIAFDVASVFVRELNPEFRYLIPFSLKTLFKAGRLGRKVGEGWYKYEKKGGEK
jgi:3-hydroxybutyryl-CoA dehydrogenase